MKQLLLYIAETILCSGVLYLFYRMVLDRRAPLTFCRAYLVLSMVVAAVIPALRIPVWNGKVVYFDAVPTPVPEELQQVAATVPAAGPAFPELFPALCEGLYGLVTALALLMIGWQWWRILRCRRGARIEHTPFYSLAESSRVPSPFSFFRWIYVPRGYSDVELSCVISHERSHILRGHSFELVFMEFLKSFLWFNPFVWMARRSLVEVQEFQADRDVLGRGFDPGLYRSLIFRQLFGGNPVMTNGLNNSLTKKRFMMMANRKNGRYALLKAAAAVPVVGVLITLFSFTEGEPVYMERVEKHEISVKAVAEPVQGKSDTVTLQPQKIEVRGSSSVAVSGTVTDAAGKPVAGALVRIKGTLNGVKADAQGRYVINAAEGDVLVFEAANMASVAKKPAAKLDVVLVPEKASAGQTTIEGTWTPGMASMYVVDGFVYEDKLESLDMNNVASVTVLKDKAALAIYGEKAKDGVVVIETKDMKKNNPTYSPEDSEEYTDRTRVRYVSPAQTPYIIMDGKPVTAEEMNDLPAANIESISVLKDAASLATYGEKGRNGVILITTKKGPGNSYRLQAVAQDADDADAPYLLVEEMPRFEGGDLRAFQKWVQSRLQYPDEPVKAQKGRVTLTFIVEKDGTVSHVEVIQSPSKAWSQRIAGIVASSPRWTPGKQQGKTVRVKQTLPVQIAGIK